MRSLPRLATVLLKMTDLGGAVGADIASKFVGRSGFENVKMAFAKGVFKTRSGDQSLRQFLGPFGPLSENFRSISEIKIK